MPGIRFLRPPAGMRNGLVLGEGEGGEGGAQQVVCGRSI